MKILKSHLEEKLGKKKNVGKLSDQLTKLGLEVDSITKIKTDYCIDIDLTPNRGDCFSALGVAREIAAADQTVLKKEKSLLKFNEVGIENFRKIIFEIDPSFVQNNHDKHRLLRAYGVFLQTKKNISFWYERPRVKTINKNNYSFFITSERKSIYKKCEIRFEDMLAKGAIDEVKKLHNLNIDRSLPISKSLGVKWLLSYLDNNISYEEAVKLSKRDTRRYVKRQFTWFAHNYIPYKTINL